MKIRGTIFRALASCVAAGFLVAAADGAGQQPSSPVLVSSVRPQGVSGSLVREIYDPSSGARWMLVQDAEHPGGPGRLILARPGMRLPGQGQRGPMRASMPVVIHAGDAMLVEEHTPVVDAVLEAVALGPAAVGSPVRVRLRVGGRVVRAIASAAGRGTLAPGGEALP
ncbi:MAG TPA: hypothetical protein VG225_00690 [Terracidiphilus sp.]|jgi:hypothetical protein|nr:hypothetical protein [Terracidiphilus sp.]